MAKLSDMRGIRFDPQSGDYACRRSLCASCGLTGECSKETSEVHLCSSYIPVLRFKPPHMGWLWHLNSHG